MVVGVCLISVWLLGLLLTEGTAERNQRPGKAHVTFLLQVIMPLLPETSEWSNACAWSNQNARFAWVFWKLESIDAGQHKTKTAGVLLTCGRSAHKGHICAGFTHNARPTRLTPSTNLVVSKRRKNSSGWFPSTGGQQASIEGCDYRGKANILGSFASAAVCDHQDTARWGGGGEENK